MTKGVVLFVDDEENVLNAIKRAAVDEPFTSLFAGSAEEALRIMNMTAISVLVTDMRMPERDGLSLLREVKTRHPETIRIVLSGQALLSLEQVLEAINHGDIFRFITKPWKNEEDLFSAVRQAVDYYVLRHERDKLAVSLQQRNNAYKSMLKTLEEKFSRQQDNHGAWEQILNIALETLEKDLQRIDPACSRKMLTKIKLTRKFADAYVRTMPPELRGFRLADIVEEFNKYISNTYSSVRYQQQVTPNAFSCTGNKKVLLMILFAIVDMICSSVNDRKFKYIVSTQPFPDKGMIRMNNVIEFGYVDGAQVLIDEGEVLTHDNLEYSMAFLAKIGLPHDIVVTYTYVNQNTSLISVVADFLLVG